MSSPGLSGRSDGNAKFDWFPLKFRLLFVHHLVRPLTDDSHTHRRHDAGQVPLICLVLLGHVLVELLLAEVPGEILAPLDFIVVVGAGEGNLRALDDELGAFLFQHLARLGFFFFPVGKEGVDLFLNGANFFLSLGLRLVQTPFGIGEVVPGLGELAVGLVKTVRLLTPDRPGSDAAGAEENEQERRSSSPTVEDPAAAGRALHENRRRRRGRSGLDGRLEDDV